MTALQRHSCMPYVLCPRDHAFLEGRAVTYENRWYECEVGEADEREMPDFARVPAEKREEVERRWRERNYSVSVWKLWGPQIDVYAALPDVTVRVLRPCTSA